MQARADVWLVDGRSISDAVLDGFIGSLSAGELARYRRFVRAERRRQFLIGRVLARQALGDVLGVAPQGLTIDDVAGQRPVLGGADQRASFSISHSGQWVACAVSNGAAIGLDIEILDPARDIAALAQQAFDDEQCAWLSGRPETSRLRDFYRLWSTQEAAIKLGEPVQDSAGLFHPELSIMLCSAGKLLNQPHLVITEIAG